MTTYTSIPPLIQIRLDRSRMTEIQWAAFSQESQNITFEIRGYISEITSKQLILETHISSDLAGDYTQFIFAFNYDNSFRNRLLEFQRFDYVSCKGNKIMDQPKSSGYLGLELSLLEIEKINLPTQTKNKGCFIATECYGSYYAPEVLILRQYRDKKLLKTFFGKIFVQLYYFVSPFIARLLSKSYLLKKIVRHYFLAPIILKLQRQKKYDK